MFVKKLLIINDPVFASKLKIFFLNIKRKSKTSSMYIIIIFSSFFVLCYYRLTSKSELHFLPTPRNKELLANCGYLSSPSFLPYFFLPSAFFQTLLSSFGVWNLKKFSSFQERVKNAETTLDWVRSDENSNNNNYNINKKVTINGSDKENELETLNGNKNNATQNYNNDIISNSNEINNNLNKHLLIIPGLTGKVTDPYIQAICQEAFAKGFKPIVYNNRWLVKPPTFPPKGQTVDFIDDLKKTIDYLSTQKRIDNLYCIGISYGSNLLCNYLGRYPNENRIKAACSVGNPFDFYKNQNRIGYLANKMLTFVLIKALKDRKQFYYESGFFQKNDIDSALKSKTYQEFDDYLTIKMLGFESVKEYYEKISCVHHLHKITTPLLLLQAKDDPISHKDCIPFDVCKKNENLFLLLTARGGHIGWVEGVVKTSIYFPKPCLEFMSQF